MPVLDPRHDRQHPVEGDDAWSESYYFNAYDPATDAGFFTRIGVRPNEGTIDVSLHVWLPRGRFASCREKREQTEMISSPLEVGAVTYRCLEEGKRWVLTADGDGRVYEQGERTHREAPLRMEAHFDALTPLIGADGQGREGSGASAATRLSTGKGHLEQSGRWTGWIEIDDERFDFGPEARGNRDKSWGPRKWGGPQMWRWFSINIGDDVHFGGIRIGTESGDLHRGWVWKDGTHASVREWRVKTGTHDDGVTQKTVDLTVLDSEGREHALHADVMRVIPGGANPGGTIVNEGLARWTHEGATGYGIAEYLHQFHEDGTPKVAIE